MKGAVIFFGFNNPRKHKRGVENVIAVQMQALPHEVKGYYIFFDERPSLRKWGRVVAIGITAGPLRFLLLNWVVAGLCARLRKQNRQVILHSHNYLISAFMWRRTDIFSVHDGLWYLKRSFGTRAPGVFWLIEKWVYRRSRILHCNSQFTYKTSLLCTTGKPVTVVFCSTPLEQFRQSAEGNPVRVVPSDQKLVLSVRSIEARARIDLILEAAALASSRMLGLHFVVAGKGPLLQHFCQEIGRRGLRNISLLGYVGDAQLAQMYAGCDAVLMLCEYGEGFGIPVIEGYLFGKNVIASDRCAVPEILARTEDLVPNDAEAILSRLAAVMENPVDSKTLIRYYESRFSNRVITAQFRELYLTAFGLIRA